MRLSLSTIAHAAIASVAITGVIPAGAVAAPVPGTTTITFSDLPIVNFAAFSTTTQNGYTFSDEVGQSYVGTNFGNPAPSIIFGAGYFGGPMTGFRLTAGGALFSLNSFQVATQGTIANYTVTGLRDGIAAYTLSGAAVVPGTQFGTFDVDTTVVDTVLLSFTSVATNLDNLVVTATPASTPEPSAWAMTIIGCGVVGVSMRRRNRERQLGNQAA